MYDIESLPLTACFKTKVVESRYKVSILLTTFKITPEKFQQTDLTELCPFISW